MIEVWIGCVAHVAAFCASDPSDTVVDVPQITHVSSDSRSYCQNGNEFLVDMCFSSCVAICQFFMATNGDDIPPLWLGAPVLEPRMFTTPAGENDETLVFLHGVHFAGYVLREETQGLASQIASLAVSNFC